MKIRTVIIDDEEISRKILVQTFLKIEHVEVAGEFSSSLSALAFLTKNKVDLIISDVEMPDMSGIELIQSLAYRPKVIFITAHENYAARAFDVDVTDYVVKPVTLSRLLKAIGKVRTSLHTTRDVQVDQFLFVRKNQGLIRIDFSEIQWIQADADYMYIQTERENYLHLSTLKALEEKLPEEHFIRVHRSYIVRIDKIDAIEDLMVVIGKKAIPISRSYWEPLKTRLQIT